jgi:hypothetical protein
VVTLLILLIVVGGAGLAVLIARLLRPNVRHDPVEYYRGWSGYRHPIHLDNKVTKEEAEAIGAAGAAYLIGYFDAEGKLTRVVKMLRGAVFFEYLYTYHPNGKRRSAEVTRNGCVTVLEYDTRGRGQTGKIAF